MTVEEALTVQAGLQKLDNKTFVASVAWWEPAGVNECQSANGTMNWSPRLHVAQRGGRCSYCGKGPSVDATFERLAE